MSAREYPVSELVLSPDCQARADVSHDAINDYAEVYRTAPETMPPVLVWMVGGVPYVVDGYHRVTAAIQAGAEVLPVEYAGAGDLRGAVMWACAANKTNGVRRTRADLHKAIGMMIKVCPGYSDRSIATQIGCSQTTIGAYRANQVSKLDTPTPSHTPDTRTDIRGVERPATQPKQDPKPDKPPTHETAKRDVEPETMAVPAAEAPTDDLPEPPKTAEVDEYADHIRLLRSRIKRHLGERIHVTTPLAALEHAEGLMRMCAPVDCPDCDTKAIGCRTCGERGYVSRGEYGQVMRGRK